MIYTKTLLKHTGAIFLTSFSLLASAQWTDNGATITTSDLVGLSITPTGRLHVGGSQTTNRIIQEGGTYTELAQRDWDGCAGILFSAYTPSSYVNGGLATVGNTKYKYNANIFGTTVHSAKMMLAGHNGISFFISPPSTGAGNDVVWGQPVLSMHQNRSVGIGTSQTLGYKLAVNGVIGAKEVKVETTSAWPDYVFCEGYELPSLSFTKKFILDKGHLPGIPSADEVAEEGIALGEMNALLLEKIEELTLYAINQEEEIEQLNSRVSDQEQKIEEMEVILKLLAKKLSEQEALINQLKR